MQTSINIYKKYVLETYIHLAICVSLLTAFSYLAISIPISWSFVLFAGLGSYVIYNYHFLFDFNGKELISWLKSRQAFIPFIILTICGFLMIDLVISTWLILVLALVASFIYFYPYKKINGSLRQISYLKILLIALVFSLISSVIPFMEGTYSSKEIILLGLSRMFFVASLAISFDIGDLLTDTKQHTRTLPTIVGNNVAKYIGIIFLILAFLIDLYSAWVFLIDFDSVVALFITYLFSSILLIISQTDKSKHFYLFAVDGMMALPFLILFLTR